MDIRLFDCCNRRMSVRSGGTLLENMLGRIFFPEPPMSWEMMQTAWAASKYLPDISGCVMAVVSGSRTHDLYGARLASELAVHTLERIVYGKSDLECGMAELVENWRQELMYQRWTPEEYWNPKGFWASYEPSLAAAAVLPDRMVLLQHGSGMVITRREQKFRTVSFLSQEHRIWQHEGFSRRGPRLYGRVLSGEREALFLLTGSEWSRRENLYWEDGKKLCTWAYNSRLFQEERYQEVLGTLLEKYGFLGVAGYWRKKGQRSGEVPQHRESQQASTQAQSQEPQRPPTQVQSQEPQRPPIQPQNREPQRPSAQPQRKKQEQKLFRQRGRERELKDKRVQLEELDKVLKTAENELAGLCRQEQYLEQNYQRALRELAQTRQYVEKKRTAALERNVP